MCRPPPAQTNSRSSSPRPIGTVTTKQVDLLVENSIPVIHTYDLNGNLETVYCLHPVVVVAKIQTDA